MYCCPETKSKVGPKKKIRPSRNPPIIRHTLFRKCKLTLLTRNVAHAEFKCGQNIDFVMHSKYSTGLVSSPTLEFYLYRFRLQFLLPMDTQSSSTRALKPAQEQEVAEDWRRGPERDSSTCCRDSEQRNKKAKGERLY